MEVADRQQVGFALCQPDASSGALALGAVPVAAAVVGNTLMPAVLAGIDVAAKRRRAAVLNRRHDLELGQAQVTGLGGTIAGTFSPEDIGDLDSRWASRFSRRDPPPASTTPNAREDWS